MFMISVTREWILFMRATHSIWSVAFRSSVMPSAVAPDSDLGRIGSFDEGDVVVTYELVVQTGFGIMDGFLHFVFLLCLSMIIVHKGWSIVECTDNEKRPLLIFSARGAVYQI